MVDLIVYEEQESKYLIVINLRIIIHRTLYKKGQCIKISNAENNVLRQYNYDSIMSNFLFVDSSDDNRINFELSRKYKL